MEREQHLSKLLNRKNETLIQLKLLRSLALERESRLSWERKNPCDPSSYRGQIPNNQTHWKRKKSRTNNV